MLIVGGGEWDSNITFHEISYVFPGYCATPKAEKVVLLRKQALS
jgi:hypothetical protein